jgi:hypothetical protein
MWAPATQRREWLSIIILANGITYYSCFQKSSYIRTARAHQELGAISEAQEAIARGLRRPELQDDMGLANRLIELQTDGKGFPNNLEDFDRWMDGVLMGDKEPESAKLMKGIQGSWKKRCAAHRAALVEKHSKPSEKK